MFCNRCYNLCHYKDDLEKKVLYSICSYCDYEEVVLNPCIFKKNYNIKYKKNDFTKNIQYLDPTFPESTKECNKCNNKLKYVRGEDLSTSYFCSYCKN